MYTGKHAQLRPLQPAFIMASTGEAVTYRELDARSNRLAHLFRKRGLKRLDHFSIFMENNSRYLEACAAGERAGLYYTCVNSYLTPGELAYILVNSESRILVTSRAKLDVALIAISLDVDYHRYSRNNTDCWSLLRRQFRVQTLVIKGPFPKHKDEMRS